MLIRELVRMGREIRKNSPKLLNHIWIHIKKVNGHHPGDDDSTELLKIIDEIWDKFGTF